MLVWARLFLLLGVGGQLLLQEYGSRTEDVWSGAAIHGLATVAYVYLSWRVVRGTWQPGFKQLFAMAVVLRLLVLPLQPALSDDVYRYMHEGHMVLSGENPYLTPPSRVAEALRLPTHDRINHADVPAAYPPAVQYALAVGYLVHPTPLGMKVVFGVADLLVFVGLFVWLPTIGLPAARAIIYGLCPLMVLEFAGEGHSDSLAVLFLVGCLLAHSHRRVWLGSMSLAMASACKLMPVVLLVFVMRKAWWAVIPFVGVLAALYAPFYLDHAITSGARSPLDLFAGTIRYGDAWQHNDSLFLVVFKAADWVLKSLNEWYGETLYASYFPHRVAKVPLLLLAAAILAWVWVRQWSLEKVMTVFFMTFVTCTPTLHPWYVAFLVPFLCIYPTLGWLLFTGTVYLGHSLDGFKLDFVTRVAEYVPFYLGFFTVLRDSRSHDPRRHARPEQEEEEREQDAVPVEPRRP